MTNEHEKELKEFLEKSAEEYQDQFAHDDEAIYYSFVNGANWMRRNLSLLPEVRELVEEIKTLKDTKWFNPIINQWEPTVSVYRANKLIEALKKLEEK